MALSPMAKEIASSVATACIFAFLCSTPHLGFLLYLWFLFWLFWLPYSAYVIIRKPLRRKVQSIRVVLWLSAAFLVVCIHFVRHNFVRNTADEIISKITSYAATHGQFPSSISDVGLSEEELRAKINMGHYWRDEAGKPLFIYAVTFEPYSVFSYDFEKRTWVYEAE